MSRLRHEAWRRFAGEAIALVYLLLALAALWPGLDFGAVADEGASMTVAVALPAIAAGSQEIVAFAVANRAAGDRHRRPQHTRTGVPIV